MNAAQFKPAMLRYGILALAVLAIAWPSAQAAASPGLAGSEWRVIELAGKPSPGAGTVRFAPTTVGGKAACNRFTASFRQTGNLIEIGGIGSTRMFCRGRMALEQQLFAALSRARRYRIEAATLIIFDGDGSVLARFAG